jgi:hypothetical protein
MESVQGCTEGTEEVIPVIRAKKPATFDDKVNKPGLRAIAEMVGKPPIFPRTGGKPFKKIANKESAIPSDKFPAYWVEVLDEMMSAYQEICAYTCFRIHPVTGAGSADHFFPKSKNWRYVYTWQNYRLCCSRVNARKKALTTILDPFKIQRDWFQLELTFFQVIPNPDLEDGIRESITTTIKLLGLNDFWRDRQKDAERYWCKEHPLPLKILREESPFVAYEIYRQGKLRPGDIW